MTLRDLYTFKAPNRVLKEEDIKQERQRKVTAIRKFFYTGIVLKESAYA